MQRREREERKERGKKTVPKERERIGERRERACAWGVRCSGREGRHAGQDGERVGRLVLGRKDLLLLDETQGGPL